MAMNRSSEGKSWMLGKRSGLLAPARAVLDRLKYPQKFALISLLFILPLGVVMYVLLSEFNDRIRYASREMEGAQYLRPLRALQGHAGQSLFIVTAYGGGDVTLRPDLIRQQALIDEDFKALARVERGLRRKPQRH